MLAPAPTLSNLAERIKAEHVAAMTALQSALVHAIAAGDLLIEAKSKVKHRQWLPWLEACSVPARTASRYMMLARRRREANDYQRSEME